MQDHCRDDLASPSIRTVGRGNGSPNFRGMCAALRRRVVRTRGQFTPAELDDLLALAALLLAGCGEPASTYDDRRGRYVSTDEYHRDQIERAIDQYELQRERDRSAPAVSGNPKGEDR